MTELKIGKLPPALLYEILREFSGAADPDVVLGPRVGTDAAVIRLSEDRYLVAATDPITFTAERIGWYAVHVNANDVAVCGARPRWFLVTVLLPERTNREQVAAIMRTSTKRARSLAWLL